jgi:hypothetical protein
MSDRLHNNHPLTVEEHIRAEEVIKLLHGTFGALSMRQRRSLLRALRRVLAELDDGYPDRLPKFAPLPFENATDDEIHAAAERSDARENVVHKLGNEKRTLCRELRLAPAVAKAAEHLGLERRDDYGQLDWRRSSWPVTIFVHPPRHNPSVRFGRA